MPYENATGFLLNDNHSINNLSGYKSEAIAQSPDNSFSTIRSRNNVLKTFPKTNDLIISRDSLML